MAWATMVATGLLANIGESVAGAAIFALVAAGVAALLDRRGNLAGDWLQVTYDSDDAAMKGEPWSIEWLRFRQRRRAPHDPDREDGPLAKVALWSRVQLGLHRQAAVANGAMWRVHPFYFKRLWLATATVQDPIVDGIYWAERGDGGHGRFVMLRVAPGLYRGTFEETEAESSGYHYRPVTYRMEWVRWGSRADRRYRPLLNAELENAKFLADVPSWIQRRIRGEPSAIAEQLAYAGAASDPRPALELEAEKRRREIRTQPDDAETRRHRAEFERHAEAPEETVFPPDESRE